MNHKFLEPIKVGNVELKNRIMYLAMAKYYSNMDGTISERDLAYVASIAKGGTALIVPGAMVVDPEWPSVLPMQPHIHNDGFIPGLTRLAAAAHDNGAKILFQLWNPGEVLYAGTQPPTVNDLTVEQIHHQQDLFEAAAIRAVKAGADGVEIQICHTYMGNQFFSRLWNHRTDEYGADSMENRLRFSTEILERVRKVLGPDKILAVKLQGYDFQDGGITPEDAAEAAPYIENAGADMISVSGGGSLTDMFGMMGDGSKAEGWKVPGAAAVKKVVNIPVCATGSIRHPEVMDKIISEGDCDMIGMGRGLFAEREFVNKCTAGKENTLKFCISCMNCVAAQMFPDQSQCSVNPNAGRESTVKPLVKDGANRTVVIVGAGPAGMEAAVTLKQREFNPIVLEKGDKIGGSVNLAKLPPNKHKFQWSIGYYENMVKELNIDVRLNTTATAEMIADLKPYAVLIASGSSLTTPPIENLDKGIVYQSHELLEQAIEVTGKNIVVIGGGQTGVETALYLAARNNKVTVADFAPAATMDLFSIDFQCENLLDYIHCGEQGVALLYQHKVTGYDGKTVSVESIETGEKKSLPVDILVLSTGVRPNDALYSALIASGVPNVYKVGDANVTGKIVKAVQNGSKFALALK